MDQPSERPRRGRRKRQPSDDPDIRGAQERLLVLISRDAHALRARHGWSQDATAYAAGLHPDTVQAIEKADSDPRLSTLVRLFYSLGYELQIGLRPTPPRVASPVVTG